MKKIAFTLILALLSMPHFFAQEKSDTTEIKIKNKKIIVVEDNNAEFEDLKDEFQARIEVHQKKIKALQEKIETLNKGKETLELDEQKATQETKIADVEKQIAEEEKQIAALEKAIANLEKDDEEFESIKDRMSDKFSKGKDKTYDFKKQKRSKKFESHWGGFLIGYNTIMNADNSFDLSTTAPFMQHSQSKSYEMQLNFMDVEFPIIRQHLGLATGLGFQWNHIELSSPNILAETDGIIGGTATTIDFNQHTLNTLYFNIPLILELQFADKRGKKFYINGGGYAGVKMESYISQSYSQNNVHYQTMAYSDYQIAPFHYGLVGRIGYRFINLYAMYSKSTFFNTNKGPELYKASAGLAFNF